MGENPMDRTCSSSLQYRTPPRTFQEFRYPRIDTRTPEPATEIGGAVDAVLAIVGLHGDYNDHVMRKTNSESHWA